MFAAAQIQRWLALAGNGGEDGQEPEGWWTGGWRQEGGRGGLSNRVYTK